MTLLLLLRPRRKKRIAGLSARVLDLAPMVAVVQHTPSLEGRVDDVASLTATVRSEPAR